MQDLSSGPVLDLSDEACGVGDQIRFLGPYGMLKLRPSHRPILMVGGGSGLAPLLSILRDMADRGIERVVTFFFGARTEADLYGLEDVQEVQQRLANLSSFRSCRILFIGVGRGDWIGHGRRRREVPAVGHDAYLCGPPGMIEAATNL